MKNRKKILLTCLAGYLVLTGFTKKNDVVINSPDHKIEVKFNLSEASNEAQYFIYYMGKKVLGPSRIGLQEEGDRILGKNVSIDDLKKSRISQEWKPVYGEKDKYPDHFNQATISLKDRTTRKTSLIITFRCYNEGVAFRYAVPKQDSNEATIVTKDLTSFVFPGNVTCWASNWAQGPINKLPIDSLKGEAERPLLVKEDSTTWLALGEAALVNFARMKFILSKKNPYTLNATLGGNVEEHGAFFTPWRYVMVAEKPGNLLEHDYLSLDLNNPDQLKNTSWIKPGKVIREVTLTTQGGLACIDFAAAHHFQYIEFDAGWYGAEDADSSNATRVAVDPARSKGAFDLQKVIRYGKSKGIGVILYVNYKALKRQLDTLLPLYESWGIKGLKFGFVSVGTQEANTWLMAAVRKAVRYHLMVDIHDEYRPTGYSRTYPNLVTQEGVRGDETIPPNYMVLRTLFTRMLAGAADQTNCYFDSRVAEMGSHASQMAKAICIYSPFQFLFWYDRPQNSPGKTGGAGGSISVIKQVPELKFFDELPTTWNDTKVLGGYPGRYAIVARRKDRDWFIGCLNGKKEREFNINLDFLPKGIQYNAIIYYDNPDGDSITKVGITKIPVNNHSIIKREILAENGAAIYLSPEL